MKKLDHIPAGSIVDAVEGLRQGRERETNFRRLFDTFYRPVFRFFEKRGFSIDESHDLTQETFIRVYNGINSFRHEAPFEAWMFQIAANTYRNALRERATQKRAGHHLSLVEVSGGGESERWEVEALTANQQPNPLDDVLQTERQRVLREAIETLPEQMRRCVMLRVYQDLSYGQIAVVMHLSIETVKSHLHQARRQLKEKLAGYFEVPEF